MNLLARRQAEAAGRPVPTPSRAALVEPLEARQLLASSTGIRAYVPSAAHHHDTGVPTHAAGGGRLIQRAARSTTTAVTSPNLTISSLIIVDANNVPANPVLGQMVLARATWTVSGLAAGTQYVVRFAMDGVQVDSGTITHGGDGSYYWYRGGWYASPGSHTVTATIDGAGVIAESNEGDNTASTTFSPSSPATLPAKLIQPIGKVRNQGWFIYNYADVDPRTGIAADYTGGTFQYDGHDAIDAGPADFAQQGEGVSVNAAMAGTVVEVLDGYFDRETSMGNRPGNHVLIDHGNGWQTLYYHFAANSITVKVGDTVTAGQTLGLMGSSGSSGSSTGTHLHLTLLKGGAPVETGYALSTYWVDPPPYAGNAPSAVTDSWISNYNNTAEFTERQSTVDLFATSTPVTLYYVTWSNNWKTTDTFTLQFLRPNGTVAQSANYTPTANYSLGNLWWSLPYSTWSTSAGSWTAVTLKNGQELDRRPFTVTGGAGKPEAKLTAGTSHILDGRTTPIDLGTVSVFGTAATASFTLSNHGSAPLSITGLSLPAGVQVVTALPSTLAVGASATLAIRLDSSAIGLRSGEVAILTNDDDEGRYTFTITGQVTGTPNHVAEALSSTSASGIPFRPGTAAKLIDPGVTVAANANTDYAGVVVRADLYGGGVYTGDGLQLIPGSGLSLVGDAVIVNGADVGTVSGTATSLSVTLKAGATRAIAQTVLQRFAYALNSSAAVGRRYVRLSIVRTDDLALGSSVTKTITYDNLPRPELTLWDQVFATAQGVSATFSADVSASLSATDVKLTNALTGAAISAIPTIVTNPLTRSATINFRTPANQPLPNGRYAVRLSGNGVTSANGLPLFEDVVLAFFTLQGDANHDAVVNFNDFLTLHNRFGAAGTFADGDFDYNGRVDFTDFLLLQNNFGLTV